MLGFVIGLVIGFHIGLVLAGIALEFDKGKDYDD